MVTGCGSAANGSCSSSVVWGGRAHACGLMDDHDESRGHYCSTCGLRW